MSLDNCPHKALSVISNGICYVQGARKGGTWLAMAHRDRNLSCEHKAQQLILRALPGGAGTMSVLSFKNNPLSVFRSCLLIMTDLYIFGNGAELQGLTTTGS